MFYMRRKPSVIPANLDQRATTLSDDEIVERVLGGETDLYQLIVQRHSQLLQRVAWAIVQNEHEAEDVVQETHVRAYEHLTQFAGRSLLSTWLTRIAVHEAWKRMKRRSKQRDIGPIAASLWKTSRVTHTPEHDLLKTEALTVLKREIDALPQPLRSVFLMRSLKQMSAAEIAKSLGITEQAVKMRFLRARHILRRAVIDTRCYEIINSGMTQSTLDPH
jgi:RNA polymerase sigma-70 factor, ECF subfamily